MKRETLIKNLQKNVMQITFNKVSGEERVMHCTLHETIDRQFEVHSEEEFKKEHGVDRNIEERLDILKKKIKKFEAPVA